MCVNMRRLQLASGLTVEVPCHCCWQCRADKVRNWVGKAMCEAQTSAAVDFVTLTYCDVKSKAARWVKQPVESEKYKRLDYTDVQKYLKRIRKAGYKVRYIVAGEYGEQKGRAHWHILLFWQDKRPPRRAMHGNEWQDQFWRHGHVNYQRFDEAAARYVAKYLLKWDTVKEPTRKTVFRYSARPGIGFKWICDNWVQLHIDQRLAPQSPKYTVGKAMRGGVRIYYKMTPHCQLKFVKEFERRWRAQIGGHPPPSSWCDKVLDRDAKRYVSDALERRQYVKKPHIPPPNGEPVFFDEKLNVWYFDCGGFRTLRFFWSFNERGERAWERDIVIPSKAASSRAQWASGATEAYRTATAGTTRSTSSAAPNLPALAARPLVTPSVRRAL